MGTFEDEQAEFAKKRAEATERSKKQQAELAAAKEARRKANEEQAKAMGMAPAADKKDASTSGGGR